MWRVICWCQDDSTDHFPLLQKGTKICICGIAFRGFSSTNSCLSLLQMQGASEDTRESNDASQSMCFLRTVGIGTSRCKVPLETPGKDVQKLLQTGTAAA